MSLMSIVFIYKSISITICALNFFFSSLLLFLYEKNNKELYLNISEFKFRCMINKSIKSKSFNIVNFQSYRVISFICSFIPILQFKVALSTMEIMKICFYEDKDLSNIKLNYNVTEDNISILKKYYKDDISKLKNVLEKEKFSDEKYYNEGFNQVIEIITYEEEIMNEITNDKKKEKRKKKIEDLVSNYIQMINNIKK